MAYRNDSDNNGTLIATQSRSSANKWPIEALIGVSLGGMISVAVNSRVLYVVLFNSRRRRTVNMLVAHLSVVSIFLAFIINAYTISKFWTGGASYPAYCGVQSFIRNTVNCVFPWNVVVIIHESMKPFKRPVKLHIFRLISLVWILAGVGNLGSFLMIQYQVDGKTHTRKCKEVHLFGKFGFTLAHELFKFFFYHLVVVAYLIHALLKIRASIRYYHQINVNRQLRRKVQLVRYVYAHSLVFILLWIPRGIFWNTYKLVTRMDLALPPLMAPIKLVAPLTLIFLIASPLIYLKFVEGTSAAEFLFGRNTRIRKWVAGERESNSGGGNGRADQDAATSAPVADGGGVGKWKKGNGLSEISRISTFANSGTGEGFSGVKGFEMECVAQCSTEGQREWSVRRETAV